MKDVTNNKKGKFLTKQHEKVTVVYCGTAHPDDLVVFVKKDRCAQLVNAGGYGNIEEYEVLVTNTIQEVGSFLSSKKLIEFTPHSLYYHTLYKRDNC